MTVVCALTRAPWWFSYGWEVVVLLRKILVVSVASFIEDPFMQVRGRRVWCGIGFVLSLIPTS